ncbi:MAG: hypothetical protein DHS20C17_24890 [Cyclobacteriaceae bacterium]|nr:MAG: hypothetical protein DHS20C17_24890 [Cyclobacteriaceae bacterium]
MDVPASIEIINQSLKASSMNRRPAELYQPMEYILGVDSRRNHPLLTLWGCHLLSGDIRKALTPSLGVEWIHSFLMIHEDLLDHKVTRFGKDCVHIRWNDNVAILSGDAMIFRAYELLICVETRLIKSVVKAFNQCFIKICEAKQLQLNAVRNSNNPDDLKFFPGALSGFSLQLGTLVGGGDERQVEAARDLGNSLADWRAFPGNQDYRDQALQALSQLNAKHQRTEEFIHWAGI